MDVCVCTLAPLALAGKRLARPGRQPFWHGASPPPLT
jgi:hypothetical protein